MRNSTSKRDARKVESTHARPQATSSKRSQSADDQNLYIQRKLHDRNKPPRNVHTQYGRKCQTCKGELFEQAVGIGIFNGREVTLIEAYCPNNCCYDFQPNKFEIATAKKITGVKLYAKK